MNNKWKFIPSFLSDVGAATPNEANEKETFIIICISGMINEVFFVLPTSIHPR